jgi:hypothetical protein
MKSSDENLVAARNALLFWIAFALIMITGIVANGEMP